MSVTYAAGVPGMVAGARESRAFRKRHGRTAGQPFFLK